MSKMRVKTGDKVVVIAGKDKSKSGRILKVFPQDGRVLVEGINVVKRHSKPSQANPDGGILEKEAPIHVSNVAIADPKTGEPARVGYKIGEDGKKVRYSKKSGEVLE